MENIIQKIAKENLRFDTLETQNSDSLDFKEQAVWDIKAALEEAYRAGQNAASHKGAKFEGMTDDGMAHYSGVQL